MSFGYGKTLCPVCYNGEDDYIFPDYGYWLNRLLYRFIPDKKNSKKEKFYDEIMLEHVFRIDENEIIHRNK